MKVELHGQHEPRDPHADERRSWATWSCCNEGGVHANGRRAESASTSSTAAANSLLGILDDMSRHLEVSRPTR